MYFGGKPMTAFGGFATVTPSGAVLYEEQQTLTEEQKEQARTNIGAVSEALVLEIMSESEIFAGLLERISSLETRVQDLENSTPAMITFTVDGIEYTAEPGMTWREFIESEYNTPFECPECGNSRMSFYDEREEVAHGLIGGVCYDCNCGALQPLTYFDEEDQMLTVNVEDTINPNYEYST